MAIADIVHHAIRDHDPHPGLFDAMLASLRALGTAGPNAALMMFLWATLTETGYRPELAADARSGSELDLAADTPLAFSPRLGGFFALSTGERAEELGAWRVRVETLRLLLHVSRGNAVSSGGDNAVPVERAARLLASYLREVIGTDIASLAPALGL
jgi:recombinational DNA repair protein (RecF pathway)